MSNYLLECIADELDTLEIQLRQLGWWGVEPPSSLAFQSCEPFCVDTMAFAEWLQWVYLPKMKHIILAGQVLPASSGLSEMAEEAWKGMNVDTSPIQRTIGRLDALVNSSSRSLVVSEF